MVENPLTGCYPSGGGAERVSSRFPSNAGADGPSVPSARPAPLEVIDTFSGIGGISLGLETAGMRTVAFCEAEPIRRHLLAHHWPGVPIYHDIRTLTADQLRRDGVRARLICGGFPCQDISFAGDGAGLDGERSGRWFDLERLIREFRPDFVLLENVSALLVRGLDRVLGGLAALGFDAWWDCLPACAAGAPHIRDRIWIVAYPGGEQYQGFGDALRWAIAAQLDSYADEGRRNQDVGEPEHSGEPSPSGGEPDGLRQGRRGDWSDDVPDPGRGRLQPDDGPGDERRAPGAAEGEGLQREWGGADPGPSGPDVSDPDGVGGRRQQPVAGRDGAGTREKPGGFRALPDTDGGRREPGTGRPDQRGLQEPDAPSHSWEPHPYCARYSVCWDPNRCADPNRCVLALGGPRGWSDDGPDQGAPDACSAGLPLAELETLQREGWWDERRATAERGWRQSFADVGRASYGFSAFLDRSDDELQTAWATVIAYAAPSNRRPAEIVRDVFGAVEAEALREEAGGSTGVRATTALLAFLRKLATYGEQVGAPLASPTTPEERVRGVRRKGVASGPSRGPGRNKRRSVEPPDPMQVLPPFLARCAEAAWVRYRRTDAAADIGFGWEDGFARVAKDIPARVGRLAGLGDSVVPQIPAIIGRAILYALEVCEP